MRFIQSAQVASEQFREKFEQTTVFPGNGFGFNITEKNKRNVWNPMPQHMLATKDNLQQLSFDKLKW